MRRFLWAACLLPLFLAATPAAADTANEELYSRYHQSIQVARRCLDITFDQGDIDRMAAVIHQKINHDIGAKRLNLMRQAQRDADALVDAKGCESPEARSLLDLYRKDLAPVVG